VLNRYRIRSLIYIGVVALSVVVISLAATSVVGMLKFRKLTKDIRLRANELPLAAMLNKEANNLRSTLSECQLKADRPGRLQLPIDQADVRGRFLFNLRRFNIALDMYKTQLETPDKGDPRIVDTSAERALVLRIERSFKRIGNLTERGPTEFGNSIVLSELEDELEYMQETANGIPSLLKERMDAFAEDARSEYHGFILLTAFAGMVGLGLLVGTVMMFRSAIFRPLQQLIRGSERVAAGDHGYRIHLNGCREMSRLAEAFNHMTACFQQINENLAEEVDARSRELIRSEQLASVGMLAAGVAHEINNPLASIAWSAEALESRLDELFASSGHHDDADQNHSVSFRKNLARIQEEAFRCKKITKGLLDFSRLGDAQKVRTDLLEIIRSAIELCGTLGHHDNRKIELKADRAVHCEANPQEIRQVILNLLTNALDSTDSGVGVVRMHLFEMAGEAVVEVADNGCGMTAEVMQNLFEPFFTRRRDGRGTGLGLAISWRIVDEHGGQIHVESDGAGSGSRFQLCLPLKQNDQQKQQPQQLPQAA